MSERLHESITGRIIGSAVVRIVQVDPKAREETTRFNEVFVEGRRRMNRGTRMTKARKLDTDASTRAQQKER